MNDTVALQRCKTCKQKLVPKPKTPSIGTEKLLVACGHLIAFDLYVKDPFRDGRREKARARACSACRQARVEAEVAAAKERRAVKKRFPDGACFSAVYAAAEMQWTGTLTIMSVTFEKRMGGIRALLNNLLLEQARQSNNEAEGWVRK
mgnify:FL=1